MDTSTMIEIPADKLREAVKLAYDMSSPQGLGFLHAREGGLSDEDADAIIANGNDRIAASMDYIHGRACKFAVFSHDGKLFVRPSWYDHGDYALVELLEALGVEDAPGKLERAQENQRLANEKWARENP